MGVNIFVPCLMYHSLSKEAEKNIYTVLLNDFRTQMEFLTSQGYRAITVVDYLKINHQSDVPGKYVLITFDDGTESDYDLALPILKKINYKATFFIIAGRIGQPGRLSWEQLNEMKSAGMSIESHTFSHRVLSHLSPEEIHHELSESKKILEDRLEMEVSHLSLPMGVANDAVKGVARQIGYKAIWTSRFGINRVGDDLLSLRRIVVRRGIKLASFKNYLSPNLIIFQKEFFAEPLVGSFKKILGIDRYGRIKKLLFDRDIR